MQIVSWLCSHQLSPRDAGSVMAPSGIKREIGSRVDATPHLHSYGLPSHPMADIVSEEGL